MRENRFARVVGKQVSTPPPDEAAVYSFIEGATDDPLLDQSRPWLAVSPGGPREKALLLKLTHREHIVLHWLAKHTRLSRLALIRQYGVDALETAAEREWQRLHREQ